MSTGTLVVDREGRRAHGAEQFAGNPQRVIEPKLRPPSRPNAVRRGLNEVIGAAELIGCDKGLRS
jgi:hypothetical protein